MEGYFSLLTTTTISNPINCDLVQGVKTDLSEPAVSPGLTANTQVKADKMTKSSAEVEDLLKSVLVPSFPPNRSQWKKLELAIKFINKSKAEVERRRGEDQGGKLKFTPKEEDKVRKELSLTAREVDHKKRRPADLELLREQRQNHNEGQPRTKKLKVLGKRDSLSKLLGTVGHFM